MISVFQPCGLELPGLLINIPICASSCSSRPQPQGKSESGDVATCRHSCPEAPRHGLPPATHTHTSAGSILACSNLAGCAAAACFALSALPPAIRGLFTFSSSPADDPEKRTLVSPWGRVSDSQVVSSTLNPFQDDGGTSPWLEGCSGDRFSVCVHAT
ncbi:hypothetical protein AOLI_G00077280 [Acnodon oligacanthus]